MSKGERWEWMDLFSVNSSVSSKIFSLVNSRYCRSYVGAHNQFVKNDPLDMDNIRLWFLQFSSKFVKSFLVKPDINRHFLKLLPIFWGWSQLPKGPWKCSFTEKKFCTKKLWAKKKKQFRFFFTKKIRGFWCGRF